MAREATDLAACILKLCCMSKELLFVDPHFLAEKRFTAVFQEFIRISHLDGQTYQRIEFHTGSKIPKTVLESECHRWIVPGLPRGVSVPICRWRERVPGEKLHARYVLTERGGIHFEVGLDSGEPGQTTDVSLLNDTLHKTRWADFQPSSAAFDLVDDFTIVGR